MTPKPPRVIFAALLAGSFTISSGLPAKDSPRVFAGLTVHEWGTFTSIAGRGGQAVEWSPLTGSTDLPGFVEHFRDGNFKVGLRGTVRMETPVLYFYDSREENVSVKVSFSQGVITEWYPHATRVEPIASLFDGSLYHAHPDGSIAWDSVTVSPRLRAEFPHEAQGSRYYSARQTSATPLRVKTPTGEQQEKFLFYRGVSTFGVPLSAKLTADGKVQVTNGAEEEIPNAILFERRGSWFEEGSRLIYLVPAGFVNGILPLSIHPAPAQIARVFVGRLELVTPATKNAVERAFASDDKPTLEKYGRFLEPILQTMLARDSSSPRIAKLNGYLGAVQSSLIAQARRQK